MPYLRCVTGFLAPGRRVIQTGQVVTADDPVVAGRADLFVPLEGSEVEQATRAPGERRLMGRRDDATVAKKASGRKRKAGK